MQLPADLREATSRLLEGVSRTALSKRAARISALYRAGAASAIAVRDEADALAYAVSRLPATYAATRNALGRLSERCAGFAPRSVLDLGSGPGTASWAAADAWADLDAIAQVDSNPALLRIGKMLAKGATSPALQNAEQKAGDLAGELDFASSADLVMLSYALGELQRSQREKVLLNAWRRCAGALVIVEPGTPAGYERVLRARGLLIGLAARVVAPCPHEQKCPLIAPDWCHFAQRVSRTRDHMIVKEAEVGYEDEKFSYVIAVREDIFEPPRRGRILAQPEMERNAITAKLCRTDGSADLVTIARRDGEAFKRLRKTGWGDLL
jgi:ribosomal protein RSM22 (predicted rRNA methylase)